MEETLDFTSSFELKEQVVRQLLARPTAHNDFCASAIFQIHGQSVLMRFAEPGFKEKLAQIIPIVSPVEANIEQMPVVEWISAETFAEILPIEKWSVEASPDLVSQDWGQTKSGIQRDFIGIQVSQNHFLVVVHPRLYDSLINALRWFLPHLLLNFNVVILHSSCVLDEKDSAHVFLGVSGAGKTTVCTLSGKRKILGDDMNAISFDGQGMPLAEASILGGHLEYQGPLGKRFPIAGFYCLHQSQSNKLTAIGSKELCRKLVSSCPLAHWLNEERSAIQLLKLSKMMAENSLGFNLDFQRTNQFWSLIDGK